MGASSGRSPFSNRSVASVRRFMLWAVSRLFCSLNVADSNNTDTVSGPISLLAPPITPPMPMGSWASAITRTSGVSLRSTSSRVTNFSPALARRTIMVWSLRRS